MAIIKELGPRLVCWIIFVCVPASMGIVYIESTEPKPPMLELAEEVSEAVSPPQEHSIPVQEDEELSTKIAGESIEALDAHQGKSNADFEELMAFLTHSQAQQLTVIKEKNELIEKMKGTMTQQEEKINQVLEVSRKSEEKFESLNKKMSELEAKVNTKVQQDGQNMQRITKLFSTMPPEKVVKIAEGIDDDAMAAILRTMKEKDVATLIGSFPAKRAAALTLLLGDMSGRKR